MPETTAANSLQGAHHNNTDLQEMPAGIPYPPQYVEKWASHDGTQFTIRPIRTEDEPLMVKFHEGLSENTVYLRYFQMLRLSQRIRHERLARVCTNDYYRQIALVAEYVDPGIGERRIVGVGRLSKSPTANEAEFALLVSDQFQGHGLGTELLDRLVQVGRYERLDRITGDIMLANGHMLDVSRRMGFRRRGSVEAGVVSVELELTS